MPVGNLAYRFFVWFPLALLFTCSNPRGEDPILYVLRSEDPRIRRVMKNLEAHEIQIRYSEITRQSDSVIFRDHDFQVDDASYFYPASTVKLPIAVLALEYINELDNFNESTRFYVEGDSVETTLQQEIVKIFAVSDNAANNRLFELLGQDHINARLKDLGVGRVRIAHRLAVTDADNVTAKPLIIYLNDSTTTTLEPSINKPAVPLHLNGVLKGRGFMMEDSVYLEPFDFSVKNYYPIATQHEVLKRILFPESFDGRLRFKLGKAQRDSLLSAMKMLPYQAGYERTEYYDSYGKFFLFGDSQDPMPEGIEIFNKVGYAFGTLTDCAYIRDREHGIEFLLTATILVNENRIFNDNTYEYDEIGIPFLSALGQGIYNLEMEKKDKR